MVQTVGVNPGWYPDPFAQGWLRWWDGSQWTSHQSLPGAPAPVTSYGIVPTSPAQDIATENRWAGYGQWSFVLVAAFGLLSLLVVAPWAGHALRHDFDVCQQSFDAGTTCNTFGNGWNWRLDVFSLVAQLPQLLMTTWLFQVASVAQRLGLPARRSPGWAFGYFVPVVNLWFPYQVARDCFPPGHPDQARVAWWWVATLVTGFASIPVLIVAALGHVAAAVLVGVVLSALPLTAGLLGYRLVGRVRDAHLRLLVAYPSA